MRNSLPHHNENVKNQHKDAQNNPTKIWGMTLQILNALRGHRRSKLKLKRIGPADPIYWSNASLAEYLGTSKQTIKAGKKRLATAKIIEYRIIPGRGKATEYTRLHPTTPEHAEEKNQADQKLNNLIAMIPGWFQLYGREQTIIRFLDLGISKETIIRIIETPKIDLSKNQ